MSLELIKSALSANNTLASQMSFDAWVADEEMRGQKVAKFRRYADGDQDSNMTPEMRKLLRIQSTGSMGEFSDNHLDIIIQTMVDRLELTGVDGDDDTPDERADAPEQATEPPAQPPTPPQPPPVDGQPVSPQQPRPQPSMPEKQQESPATRWASDLLKRNRFDAMQSDVWEATVRDGDTFLMAYWDNEQKRVRWSHEPAFDGTSGMLVLYETMASEKPLLALKVWRITTESGRIGDTMRVNVYYADHVEKYIARGNDQLAPFSDGQPTDWLLDGQPIGVPVIHFRNRKAMYDNFGMSEIENALPLQDALNRTLHSMVMSAELSAFQIRWAKGFRPPTALTPGMWVMINPDTPLQSDQVVDLGTMEQGDIAPFIEMSRHLVGEMGNITNTPRLTPQGMASDASSGEALKQREIGLIGKIRRFQVKAGNAIEDLLTLSARIQTAFGEKPPQSEFFYARWKDPEIRNEVSEVDIAIKLQPHVDERTFLEMIAPSRGWDAKKIDTILEANAKERNQQSQQEVLQTSDIEMAKARAALQMMDNANGAAAA